jgi:hypothetical protein
LLTTRARCGAQDLLYLQRMLTRAARGAGRHVYWHSLSGVGNDDDSDDISDEDDDDTESEAEADEAAAARAEARAACTHGTLCTHTPLSMSI